MDVKNLLKNRNNRTLIIISIIGIVIILLSGLFEGDDTKKTDTELREEERLIQILEEIEGAGEVDVMITYKKATSSQRMMYGDTKDEIEPRGVIVVASGADSPLVRNNIREAVVAVMGVGANRVCVYKRE